MSPNINSADKGKEYWDISWWRHQMETSSALLALCAGNSSVTGEFPSQRPVTRSFDVSFDLRLNKRLNKQSWGWWFETLSCSLWRHWNDGFHFRHPEGLSPDHVQDQVPCPAGSISHPLPEAWHRRRQGGRDRGPTGSGTGEAWGHPRRISADEDGV